MSREVKSNESTSESKREKNHGGTKEQDTHIDALQKFSDRLEAFTDSKFELREIENVSQFVDIKVQEKGHIYWHGDNPTKIISLLKDGKSIELEDNPEEPGNISSHLRGAGKHGALSYRGDRSDYDRHKTINIAIGFNPSKQTDMRDPSRVDKSKNTQVSHTQTGIHKTEGKIDNPEYIIIRTPAAGKGSKFDFKAYRVIKKENST